MSRSLFTSLFLALAVVWSSGSVANAARSTPEGASIEATFMESECAYELPDGFTAGENAQCGTVTVPLYYDRDTDETVSLPLIRLESTSDSPVNPPLVMLQGGPGQTLQSILVGFGGDTPLFLPLLETQDVILFDQRGMGRATPSMICPTDRELVTASTATPTDGEDTEAESTPSDPLDAFVQQVEVCKDDLLAEGLQFDAFTVRNSAADIDSIRLALGLDQIDLYGVSYGSRLAMEYLRDYSPAVRASILASPSPADRMVVMEDQYLGISESLRLIFEGCGSDPACAEANPDLEVDLQQAFDSMNASPLSVSLPGPVTGESIEIPMDGYGFANLIQNTLWVGPTIPLIPSMITSAANGDTSVIEQVLTLQPYEPISLGITFTLFCQDVIPFRGEDEVRAGIEQHDLLPFVESGAIFGTETLLYPSCEVWDLEPSDPVSLEPVSSDVPTLILSGRYDPITMPAEGGHLLETFPNAQHVVLENASHGPSPATGTCPADLMAAYPADIDAPLDTSCAETPIDFSPGPSPEASPAG